MTNPTSPNGFEDRLLAALRPIVAHNPTPTPVATPVRARRRLVLSGAGLSTTAAAAVVAILATSGGAAPAYAVERAADGKITVKIDSLSDAAGLQAKLRADGIDAYVTYVANPKTCDPGKAAGAGVGVTAGVVSGSAGSPPPGAVTSTRTGSGPQIEKGTQTAGPGVDNGPTLVSGGGHPADAPPIGGIVRNEVNADGATFTIDPNTVPKGATLVIAASSGEFTSLGVAIIRDAKGATPTTLPCVVVPPTDTP